MYHAGVAGFGGGYVGVDVFFVLSGFLITGLLVRELEATGTIGLAAFYARRARRLLPAAAVALAVTVLASAILLPPLRVGDVAADGAAAALYASNIRFAVQATDYLQASQAPSPLLHYWSLGVEEQFYLFWPTLLILPTCLGWGSIPRLAMTIGVVSAASLVLSIVLTHVSAPWAFYSLPTRAWELGMGALIALAALRSVALPRSVAAASAIAGVTMIVAAGAVFDTGTPFPGTGAVLPTAGAGLVILAGLGTRLPLPSRLLTVAPLRWLGRISYSLYLWHWPMLVIPAAALGHELPFLIRIGLAAATVPIAAASHRWVEEPFRRGRLVGLRSRRSLAGAAALSLMLAGSSIAVAMVVGQPMGAPAMVDPDGQLSGVPGSPRPSAGTAGPSQGSARPGAGPGRTPTLSPSAVPSTASGPVPADLQPPLATARDDLPRVYDDDCHADQLATDSAECAYGDTGSTQTVVLFGDSHAAQWFPALERLATENGWRLISLTKVLCAAADHPVWNGQLKRGYPECDAWRAAALERIASERPMLVVVANSKFASFEIDGRQATAQETSAGWKAAVAGMLRRVAALTERVVLIGDTPQSAVDPPVCLSANPDDALACATPRSEAIDMARLEADRRAAADAGTAFIDPSAWLCPSEPCPVVIGSLLVYHDGGHMTQTFATALAPSLGAALGAPPTR
jgi:peptidoglycan/LPS O-acetylase OafA/YrhL